MCRLTGCKDKPTYDPGLIRCPVQIVVGEWDRETSPAQGLQVFDRLRGTSTRRYTVIGAATHSMLLETQRHQLYDVARDIPGRVIRSSCRIRQGWSIQLIPAPTVRPSAASTTLPFATVISPCACVTRLSYVELPNPRAGGALCAAAQRRVRVELLCSALICEHRIVCLGATRSALEARPKAVL